MPTPSSLAHIAARLSRFRRLICTSAALVLALALAGCLVSEERVELGALAQPLEPGLYVSFTSDGEPEEAVVARLDADGHYSGEGFILALYESDLGEDIYYAAYTDRDEGHTLYGVVEARDGVLSYPGMLCDYVPEEARKAANFAPHDDGCLVESAEQARAALAAFWRATPRSGERMRFVRQTNFTR